MGTTARIFSAVFRSGALRVQIHVYTMPEIISQVSGAAHINSLCSVVYCPDISEVPGIVQMFPVAGPFGSQVSQVSHNLRSPPWPEICAASNQQPRDLIRHTLSLFRFAPSSVFCIIVYLSIYQGRLSTFWPACLSFRTPEQRLCAKCQTLPKRVRCHPRRCGRIECAFPVGPPHAVEPGNQPFELLARQGIPSPPGARGEPTT